MNRIIALLGLLIATGCTSSPNGPIIVTWHKFGDTYHTVRAQVLPDGTFKGTSAPLSIRGKVHGPEDNGLYSVDISIQSVWDCRGYGVQTNTIDTGDLSLYPNAELTMGGMTIGKVDHSYGITIKTEGSSNK